MANNLFSKITTFINRVVDVISQGNFERVMILNQYNITFREAYLNGDLNILCKVTTSPGNPDFKHELSTYFLRSGFKVTIENDNNLEENDLMELSIFFIENKAGVRQLMAYGYDTLIIIGKNNRRGIHISFKKIATLQNYMLD